MMEPVPVWATRRHASIEATSRPYYMRSMKPSRLGLFSMVSVLAALTSSLGAVGCTSTSTSTADGGAPTGDGGACSTSGTGTISVVVTGLPDGVSAKVKLSDALGTSTDAA